MRTPLLALAALFAASPAAADTLVDHVTGVQVDAKGRLQRFSGVLIGNNGKVVRLIAKGQPRPKAAHRIDGGGRVMLPGLIDAHGHFLELGLFALQLDLTGTRSLAELQQRLGAYAAAHPDEPWLVGFGWNQENWLDGRFPTAADLDAVVAGRPVVLERVDGHALVANSAALTAAGVTSATQSPAGGKIERDSGGNPTGLFVDAAKALVGSRVPPTTSTQADKAVGEAQTRLLSVGVTAVGAMSTSRSDWAAYRRAAAAGRLQVRVMAYVTGADAAEMNARPTGWLQSDHLRLAGVKLFADGALGSRGAWLKQPYSDQPATSGLRFHSDAEMLALADQAAARGFQVAIHAIGDAANAQAISTYEKLARKYPGDRRWRIEHAQIVDPADIGRLAPAGIIASMQPTHQTSDRLMAEKRLGADRLGGAYAWQSMLKSGARLAFGSDFPVESPNPFPGLGAAISRQDVDGQPMGGWRPKERLSFAQALNAFTRAAAHAGFAERRIGALDPGKWADFILVDRDPSKVDAQTLARTQVIETWVAGKKVWQRK